MDADDVKQSTSNYVICPQNRPYGALKLDKISLVRKACIREQANHLGIKRLNNNTDINIDQEDPRFSLNLLTEDGQQLIEQGNAKEVGGNQKTSPNTSKRGLQIS